MNNPSQWQDPEFLFNELRKGNRVALGKAITLVESKKAEHRILALDLLDRCEPYNGRSIRLGITGVPGAGKSTFIEGYGKHLIEQGHQVAVLAIDPTSAKHKGSILGDKTRMAELSVDPAAFIRPTPSGGNLGGLAAHTREVMLLCEAAGYDRILVETVGVGQSEVEVAWLTDIFLLLLVAGAGDELQGIKRGIMEMADIILINKDDGENRKAAKKAKAEYASAVHLFPPDQDGWSIRVETISAIEKTGFEKVDGLLSEYLNLKTIKGGLERKRHDQAHHWFQKAILEELTGEFYRNESVRQNLPLLTEKVKKGQMSPSKAAWEIVHKLNS